MANMTEALAKRAVDRTAAERQSEYAREVRRIVEATYDHIERSGNLDPSLRDILRSCGLSTQGFYRYFRSKDELLLVLLDDGRRRLVDYLVERMDVADSPTAQVRDWIDGVLAQASHARSAARTRPFAANEERLAERFPDEQRASVGLLVGLLVGPLRDATDPPRPEAEAREDAEAIYQLVFGVLRGHLILRTRPTPSEVAHVVRFCLRGAGIDGSDGTAAGGRS
jgi:AcrR family transcriptional regulator